MINCSQPRKLNLEMRKCISYHKSLEKDLKRFIKILKQKASKCKANNRDESDNDNNTNQNEFDRKAKKEPGQQQ